MSLSNPSLSSVIDCLGGGILENNIVQLVLNRSETCFGHVAARVVVGSGRANVRNLQVEIALAATNIPDALQEFPKIAVAALFEPLIVHHKAFLDIFLGQLILRKLQIFVGKTNRHLRYLIIILVDDVFAIFHIFDNINSLGNYLEDPFANMIFRQYV